MEKDISVQDVADVIEDHINNSSPKFEVNDLVRLEFSGSQEFVNSAIHCLSHFVTDKDIRLSDPEYDNELKEKLIGYVNNIRKLHH